MDTSDLSPLAAPAPRHEAMPPRNGDRPPTLGERVQSLRLRPGGSGDKSMPRSALLPWGLSGICLLLMLAALYHGYISRPSQPANEVMASEGTPSVSAAASPSAPVGDVALESKGYVIAAHTIQISPQVGGEIIELLDPFYEGLVVKKGDQIALVDPESYDARVRSAEEQVRVAEINLREVQQGGSALREIEAAQKQMESLEAKLRISEIDKDNKLGAGVGTTRDEKDKSVSQAIADQAAYDCQKATLAQLNTKLKERVAVAEAQLRRSQADLDDALKQRKNCKIVAPISGIVLSKKAELHGYVNPLAFGAAGYLCEIADLGDLEIEIDVQERDLPRVFNDQKCIIMPEAYRRDDAFLKGHARGYEGTVARLMPTANRSKAAVPVRVKVKIPDDEAGKYLRPDMSVVVSFLNKK
jgi:multidrug resistance efflux pump